MRENRVVTLFEKLGTIVFNALGVADTEYQDSSNKTRQPANQVATL
jgi:hypothetical protein